jgi:hypothetical protein
MGIVLAFAPFIVFAIVERVFGAFDGLIAGTLTSATLLARDRFTPGRSLKLLEIGTLLLFGALALAAGLGASEGGVFGVRLRVDLGLLIIVLATLAIRRPFTLQYAREQVAPELWNSPRFVRANYVISGAWALAFALMVVADLVLVYVPAVPQRVGVIATIAILVGAVKFTSWYPDRQRKRPSE